MPTENYKGVPIPEPQDDLLSAWQAAFDAAGIIVPVGSVAAARAVIQKASDAGAPPTTAHPLYLDVNGVVYRAGGSKGAGGAWALGAIGGHTRVRVGRVTREQTYPLRPGDRWDMAQVDIGTAPYDRMIEASFTCYGQVLKGTCDLHLTVGDVNNLARFTPTQNGDTVSVIAAYACPAGTNPACRGGVTGTALNGGESQFYVNPSGGYSALIVKAYPTDMS